jgi:putative phosphoesterase
MKILVLSDSHAGLSFMRKCIQTCKPDAVVHLGDYYDDGAQMQEEYPHIPVHQVMGNCDKYRAPLSAREILNYNVCGISCYMTHGHRHYVKNSIALLLADARAAKAQIVMFGHTHQAVCYCEQDGLWVLNPGACGSWGGSVGVIETDGEKITACYLMRQADVV